MSQATIGVLGLQGGFKEHMLHVERAGHRPVLVKRTRELDGLDGLILPGGESTTMRLLMQREDLHDHLVRSGIPMFGTCAGVIMLATTISGEEGVLKKLDVDVHRNAFGRQRESFEAELTIDGLDAPYRAVFIRAPIIAEARGDTKVLARTNDGRIVAVANDKHLGVSFHPELTPDHRLTEWFIRTKVLNAAGN